ncbi:hypothetical protein [Bacillus cereus]|nr:hypothetical protein [Bacillus cereus]
MREILRKEQYAPDIILTACEMQNILIGFGIMRHPTRNSLYKGCTAGLG